MKRVKATDDLIVWLYCILSLFCFAFVNFNGALGDVVLSIPHIEGRVIIIHFGVTILFACIWIVAKFILQKKIYIDAILVCLIVKCACDLVPILTSDFRISGFFGHYAVTVSSTVCYLFYSNLTHYYSVERYLQYLFMLFGTVLSLQTIYAAIMSGLSYLDIFYKSFIVIPYGASNVIASILIPIFFFIFLDNELKFRKIVLLLIASAIILTKSRGGVLLFLACLFFFCVRRVHGKYKPILIILFCSFFLGLIIVGLSNENVRQFARGYATGELTLNSITSGRINIWLNNIRVFLSDKHILFGVGMPSEYADYQESHNLVVDIFLRCGLVGVVYYTILFYSFFKKRHDEPSKARLEDNGWFCMCCIILINSMYELCYFSYHSDVLFYTMMGLSTAKQRMMKKWPTEIGSYKTESNL